MPSQNVEEYIEAIYRLGGGDESVSTGHLAAHMHVAAPSVTTMLKRLVRDGLVKHSPYHGIALTDAGKEMAASLIRSHRLSERLLTDMIGLPWDQVHDVACKLEHVITGDLADRVYRALGEPKTCPHGNPMELGRDEELINLCELEPGIVSIVAKITHEDQGFLKYLQEQGIKPEARIELVSKSPFGDVVTIRIEGIERAMGPEAASKIWVSVINREE